MRDSIRRREHSFELTRRQFLKASLAAGGGLLISVTLPQVAALAADGDATPAGGQLSAWLRIAPDGVVTIMIPSAEMGQGVTTSLAMLIAEELDADWRQVRTELAPANEAYANPAIHMQATFGSMSIRGFFDPLRQAGAAAREMLRQAAADRWGVAVSECRTAAGLVTHADGRQASYGALAQAAAALPVPAEPALKARGDWGLIGKATPRLDTVAKVEGSAVFGIDVQQPGLLTATIAACPVFGGKLASVDDAPALAIAGVEAVIRLDDAVAVVASGYWPARKGLLSLSPQWDEGPDAALDSDRITADLDAALASEGAVAEAHGDAPAALARAATTVEGIYTLPLLAHATMEPLCATASVTADGCEIWAPTQSPARAQSVAAELTGLPPSQVVVHPTYLGGGFGRKAEIDFILQAVRIAREVGRPVKLVWSREEDIQHDYYRPAAAARLRAGLDAAGHLIGWEATLVSPSLMSRVYPPEVENGIDPTSIEGLVHLPYDLGEHRTTYVLKNLPVPTGFWRSVGNSINGFLVEGFIDEVAHAAGRDPLDLRRDLLAGRPRHLAVLNKAAEMAAWSEPAAPGRFRGIALVESMGSIVAEVAEIAIDGDRIRTHRVTCAVDCGIAINPDTIVAQMEGAIVYGLTAALMGEITIERGRVQQSNFHDYPVLRLAQMPVIDVAIIEGGETPGGVGEPSTPPIAPALVNAVFAATGRRIRSLPLTRHGFTA